MLVRDALVAVLRHLLSRFELFTQFVVAPKQTDHGLEARVLSRQIAEAILVGDRIRVRQQTG